MHLLPISNLIHPQTISEKSTAESMSIAFAQSPLTIPRPRKLYSFPDARNRVQIVNLGYFPLSDGRRFVLDERRRSSQWQIGVVSSGGSIDGSPQGEFSSEWSLDAILSMTEILFIIPPAIFSIGCVAGVLIPGSVKPIQASLGGKIFVWQFLLLVGSVAVGTLIRRRQWGRICRESESGPGVDLLARIEKVEEDLRSSATTVRVLSRQLEKLGIRFRVTRKALKDPITETAALSQKNSEATRALALQEDILEKELGEIQKVLLAMQEQQQKQLELILAIGKASKLLESERDTSPLTDQSTLDSNNAKTNSTPDKKESKQLEIQTGTLGGGNNDRP